MKICPRCKAEKDIFEFNAQGRYCKLCHKEKGAEWRAKNKEKNDLAQSVYYHKIKDTEKHKSRVKEYNSSYMPEYNKQKYIENSENYKNRTYARVATLRMYVTNIKKQSSCAKCGFNDYRGLVFHHTDRETKVKAIANMIVGGGCSLDALKKEIDKCEILCANCHTIEHWVEPKEPVVESSNSQYATFWITNGELNRKWRDSKGEVPVGFYRGRA